MNTPQPSENSGGNPSQKPNSEPPARTGKREGVHARTLRWENRVGASYGLFRIIKVIRETGRVKVQIGCFCGGLRWVLSDSLAAGQVKSCGCLRNKNARSKHPLYNTWLMMNARCSIPSQPNFHRYGGRGIRVCERWRNFQNFLQDMGSKPSPKHTLDRINSDGDYEPSNCRWATKEEQSSNTSRNRRIQYRGVSKTISQWARFLKVTFDWLHYRAVKKAIPMHEIVSELKP